MDLHKAEQLALRYMRRHGLIEQGWRFRWSNGKRQLGAARVRQRRDRYTGQMTWKRTISLSRYLVQLNGEDEVWDTILHEIAHALAGVEHGHDAHWQAACRAIGAKPRRLAGEDVVTPKARYEVVCGACRRTLAERHRGVNGGWLRRAYCGHCGPTTKGRLRVWDRGSGRAT